jgi:hypothetical protein
VKEARRRFAVTIFRNSNKKITSATADAEKVVRLTEFIWCTSDPHYLLSGILALKLLKFHGVNPSPHKHQFFLS